MRRSKHLQPLYHLASPPLSLPPSASSLLHLRTLLCYRLSLSPTPSSSPHLSEPHNFIRNPATYPNLSLRSIPHWRGTCHSQSNIPLRRHFFSSPSFLFKSEHSENLVKLGTGRGVGSSDDGELDREWELEEDEEGKQQGQHQEQQWWQQQPEPQELQEPQEPQEPKKPQKAYKRPRRPKIIPTLLSDLRYHELADLYIEALVHQLEEIQELREDLDCEYSVYSPFPFCVRFSVPTSLLPPPSPYRNSRNFSQAGVLEISSPPRGTYVLNKQPYNKQIWLSSPVSGPHRYDFIVPLKYREKFHDGGTEEEGIAAKAEQRSCYWVNTRTGKSLTELLRKELGVEIEVHYGELTSKWEGRNK